jgi:light-independent protochlorophyllide reductase subunit B
MMGFEGANVIFDSSVHPLMMGLEEHLLGMFRDDFEFHDQAHALASRSGSRMNLPTDSARVAATPDADAMQRTVWAQEAENRAAQDPLLRPRQGARATPSASPRDRGTVPLITLETLYDAKAHYSR